MGECTLYPQVLLFSRRRNGVQIVAMGSEVRDPAAAASQGSLVGVLIPRPCPDSLISTLPGSPGALLEKHRRGAGCGAVRKDRAHSPPDLHAVCEGAWLPTPHGASWAPWTPCLTGCSLAAGTEWRLLPPRGSCGLNCCGYSLEGRGHEDRRLQGQT